LLLFFAEALFGFGKGLLAADGGALIEHAVDAVAEGVCLPYSAR